MWKYPFDGECPVTKYTLYYRMMEMVSTSGWNEVIVSKHKLSTTLQLKCHKTYEMAITAWSSHGETPRNQSRLMSVFTLGGNNFQLRFSTHICILLVRLLAESRCLLDNK